MSDEIERAEAALRAACRAESDLRPRYDQTLPVTPLKPNGPALVLTEEDMQVISEYASKAEAVRSAALRLRDLITGQ